MPDLAISRARLLAAFPSHPVPPYPANLGLLPTGERDEYEGFAHTPWHLVAPRHLSSHGWDISPAIGFQLEQPPHLWSYYVPAFVLGALEHEDEHDVLDGFLARFQESEPGYAPDPTQPWWHSDAPFGNYDGEQCACVLAFFAWVQARRCAKCGVCHDWEPEHDAMQEQWRTAHALRAGMTGDG